MNRKRMNESEQQNKISVKKDECGIFNKVKPYLVFVNNIAGLYLLWVILHYAAAHLYIHYCVPSTFIGFIMSPLMVATPHCYAFRWCITRGAETITSMWIIFGTWLASKILIMSGTHTG